jgi:hypothetical protein
MKKRIFPVWAPVLTAVLFMQPARADNLLIAAKGGAQSMDFEALGSADSSLMALVQMGYEFSTFWSMTLAGELEISSSLDKGEILNRDFNLQNTALYASLRGRGEYYLIAKLGVVDTEVDFVDFPNMDDTGTAATIGMGFGKTVGLELELTGYSYKEMGSSVVFSAGWSF